MAVYNRAIRFTPALGIHNKKNKRHTHIHSRSIQCSYIRAPRFDSQPSAPILGQFNKPQPRDTLTIPSTREKKYTVMHQLPSYR